MFLVDPKVFRFVVKGVKAIFLGVQRGLLLSKSCLGDLIILYDHNIYFLSSPVCQSCLSDLYQKLTEHFRPELLKHADVEGKKFTWNLQLNDNTITNLNKWGEFGIQHFLALSSFMTYHHVCN
jgi:hypothetical protein